jgi:hypothetical protein
LVRQFLPGLSTYVGQIKFPNWIKSCSFNKVQNPFLFVSRWN